MAPLQYLMIFDEPSRRPLPKTPDLDDFRYVALKAVLSLLPGGGELFGLLASPLAKRRDDWWEDVERRLRDLEGKIIGFRFDSLADNAQFVSATLRATQAALRAHQREKLEALKNAIVNVACGTEPEADRQTIFLDLIDRFAPLHLALLRLFQDPGGYCNQKHIRLPPERDHQPLYLLLFDCLPELALQVASPVEGRDGACTQLLDVVVMELAAAALITPHLKDVYQKPPPYSRWTTHLGDDFLDFISSHKTVT